MSKDEAKTPRRVALERISIERNRQIAEPKKGEGWSEAHDDDQNRGGQLAVVAGLYCLSIVFKEYSSIMHRIVNWCWPMSWERSWWKPGRPPLRTLEIAGALLLAEMERRIRAGETE